MTKRQLIDEIIAINPTATPRFLAQFPDDDLDQYLTHLRVLSTPRLCGEPGRFEKYFRNCPTIQYTRPQWRGAMVAEPPDQCEPEPVEALDDQPYADDLAEPVRPAGQQQRPEGEPLPFADEPDQGDDEPTPDAPSEEALIELAAFIPDAVDDQEQDQDEHGDAVQTDQPADETDGLQLSAADAQAATDPAEEDDAGPDDAEAQQAPEEPLAEASRPIAAAPVRGDRGRRPAAPLSSDKQEDAETWLY